MVPFIFIWNMNDYSYGDVENNIFMYLFLGIYNKLQNICKRYPCVSQLQISYEYNGTLWFLKIHDVIKQNESNVRNIEFQILPRGVKGVNF